MRQSIEDRILENLGAISLTIGRSDHARKECNTSPDKTGEESLLPKRAGDRIRAASTSTGSVNVFACEGLKQVSQIDTERVGHFTPKRGKLEIWSSPEGRLILELSMFLR